MKVPTSGGPGQAVWATDHLESRIVAGAIWGPNGIVFGRWPQTGLWMVAAERGTPRPVTGPGKAGSWQLWPAMLPGGQAVLFTAWRRGKTSIAAASLRSGEVTTIVRDATRARYVPTGHLVYESGGNLLAVAFDAGTLKTRGTARAVVPGVGKAVWAPTFKSSFTGNAFDISAGGTLVYAPPPPTLRRLAWKDRHGPGAVLPVAPAPFLMPSLSPDGQRVVDTFADGLTRSIWIGSVGGGSMMRLTPGEDDSLSLFSPDGKWVLYTSNQDDQYNIYRIPSDGSGPPERLTNSLNPQRATSVSPDGRIVLLNDILADGSESRNVDILALEDARLDPVVKTRFWERGAVFSPDGRYIAYDSNESGRMEVYVQRYPRGGKAKVSLDGGRSPVWNPSGGELFFQGPGAIMAAKIADGVPEGPPVRLFSHASAVHDWTVAPDGRRFLVVEGGDASTSPPQINVVVNWLEELKQKVPVR